MERRSFLLSTAASYQQIVGANDRVRMGIIGCGNQGRGVWGNALASGQVAGVAVSDVYAPHRDRGLTMAPGAKSYPDFRRLLDDKDVDAVIIATPDHWHAYMAVTACMAGKDVYVEKPLALTIQEGRRMVDAARKYKRVVQVGSMQRSGAHYKEAVGLVRGGLLGTVPHAYAGFVRNFLPGAPKMEAVPKPPEIDYDLWLGPAPLREYHPRHVLYHFRWYWDYSGGQMTNWGAHDLDIVRWALDLEAPLRVSGLGGRYALEDGGETPDLQEVLYEFPKTVVSWTVREFNGRGMGGVEIHGTKANLRLTRGGYEVIPETIQKQPQAEPKKAPGSELSKAHMQNFLDCIRSRQRPNADVEEGHRTAVMCHLGNIATRLKRTLEWDAAKETIRNDAEASRWLARPYRRPWVLPAV